MTFYHIKNIILPVSIEDFYAYHIFSLSSDNISIVQIITENYIWKYKKTYQIETKNFYRYLSKTTNTRMNLNIIILIQKFS